MLGPLNTSLLANSMRSYNVVAAVDPVKIWQALPGKQLFLYAVEFTLPGNSYIAGGLFTIALHTSALASGVDLPGTQWAVALPTAANTNLGELTSGVIELNGAAGIFLPSLDEEPGFDAGFPGAAVDYTAIYARLDATPIPLGCYVRLWGREF